MADRPEAVIADMEREIGEAVRKAQRRLAAIRRRTAAGQANVVDLFGWLEDSANRQRNAPRGKSGGR